MVERDKTLGERARDLGFECEGGVGCYGVVLGGIRMKRVL